MSELQAATSICKLLQDSGFQAVFAGGYVRDSILGIKSNDIDIATSAPSDKVIKIMTDFNIQTKLVGESFSVCLVRKDGYLFEVATFRKDIKCDGRHPTSIEFASMEEDAKRRDFTINAVFFDPVAETYYDFVGGLKDIKRKNLRFVGNAVERITEDYIRVLRFLRFYSKGFLPDEDTTKIVNTLSVNLPFYVAPERISKEIMEKLLCNNFEVSFMFEILDKKLPKLFETLFPEVIATKGVQQNPLYHPEGDVYEHTMLVVNNLSFFGSSPLLILAGLYHDVGKKTTTKIVDDVITSHGHEKESSEMAKDFLERNRFSKDDISYICGIIENHMKLHQKGMKDSTLRKLMAEPFFGDLMFHIYADIISSNSDVSLFEEYSERVRQIRRNNEKILPEPIINGGVLIKMGLTPSSIFKEILKDVYDLQLEGKITSLEEGKEEVRRRLLC